jgi:MFS family permease
VTFSNSLTKSTIYKYNHLYIKLNERQHMKKHFNWALLAILALAQFMVVLDTSIVNVALPALEKSLHFSTTSLQWVITAYTLCFGGFLLLGGRASDLYGRRRMFLAGVIGFTLMSLLVGVSQNSGTVIFFRGLQGLSAAFMSPAALSIVLTSFTGRDRNKALGVWGAVARQPGCCSAAC